MLMLGYLHILNKTADADLRLLMRGSDNIGTVESCLSPPPRSIVYVLAHEGKAPHCHTVSYSFSKIKAI